MSQVLIPCPKCGKELRLRDRTNIGKKGRCPSCQHTFILNEPDEVQLELADATAPAVGTSARWVPDSAPAGAPVASRPAHSAPVMAPAPAATPFAGIGADEELAPTRPSHRKKGGARRNIGIIVGAVLGIVVAGVGYAVYSSMAKEEQAQKSPLPKVDPTRKEQKAEAAAAIELAKAASPTPGDPIKLLMVPSGASVVINLKVAELWKQDAQREEFRACFGEDLGKWVETKLKDLCLFEVSEIDSALFCLFYRAPGETPEVSGVVRLKQEAKRSVFVTKFGGEPDSGFGYPIYKTKTLAYAVAQDDPKTFGFCPVEMAGDMIASMKEPMPTIPGIEELIEHTDRDRHITVVFRPDDARVHEKTLVPEAMLPFWNILLDWLNPDEVESVAWSLHLTDKKFYSEMMLRNKPVVPTLRLSRDLRKKLDSLGTELVGAVEKMEPKTAGLRQLIGRFPAMMQVFAMETDVGAAERYVQLHTVLPERAAPNIVLASVLAWDESTRTDFRKTKAPSKPETPTSTGNETIVAKLQKKIEIDFRRTPLQDAMAYIAENTNVTIKIDGDGLKLSGFTQNMPQEMKLGEIPAIDGIKAIVKKYTGKTPNERDDMCILIEEDKKLLTLTTKAAAEKAGKKPYDLKLK